ncbi:AbrB/MazE/SpoVT family DNA-binding domain-containing protein [archaeon]|jgi:hypothetical protein|nr:AbrB/MazE/SpoVT family DNA-binding domain-containing protein [archaeon]
MIQINGKLRKWGNSFGIIIPSGVLSQEGIKEGEVVKVMIQKDEKKNVLREMFGSYKTGKSTSKIMKEIDKELYND